MELNREKKSFNPRLSFRLDKALSKLKELEIPLLKG